MTSLSHKNVSFNRKHILCKQFVFQTFALKPHETRMFHFYHFASTDDGYEFIKILYDTRYVRSIEVVNFVRVV